MIPFPSIIAGILIGAVNESWLAVFIASGAWGVISCVYFYIFEGQRRLSMLREPDRRLLFGSPAFTFFAIEWTIALPDRYSSPV